MAPNLRIRASRSMTYIRRFDNRVLLPGEEICTIFSLASDLKFCEILWISSNSRDIIQLAGLFGRFSNYSTLTFFDINDILSLHQQPL